MAPVVSKRSQVAGSGMWGGRPSSMLKVSRRTAVTAVAVVVTC
jgi:hypothetical protein